MAQTQGVPTYWLTLADQNDGWGDGHCDDAVNAALVSALDRWPNLHLLPYREWALANPGFFVNIVHLDASGQVALTNSLKAQLDAL